MYSRWRDRGGFATNHISSVWKTQNGSVPFQSSTLYPYKTGTVEQFQDNVATEYDKRIGEGQIINQPCHQLIETQSARLAPYKALRTSGPQPPAPNEYVQIDYSGSNVNNDFTHDVIPTIDTAGLLTTAATACRAKIQAPDVQGLVFLKELKQTLATLRSPLKGAQQTLDALKQKQARGAFKGAADQHLSVIFGIMPFYNDIVSALKVFQSADKLSVRMTARGFASSSATSTSTQSLLNWWPTVPVKPVSTFIDRKVTVRAYSLYEVGIDLGNAGKLGLFTEIPRQLWAVVPYSFLVDKFYALGNYLGAITPKIGIKILAEGYTVYEERLFSRTVNPYTVTDGYMTGSGGGDYRGLSIREKTRTPGSLGPYVGVSYYNKLDTFMYLALISLITQRLADLEPKVARKPRRRRI